MENNILVSCTVLTYNSSTTVIETLESIKRQTYDNIELIISDDCSTDNTVELCKKWLNENGERFVRTELLTVDQNTGVSGNGNRALAVCRGEWQKGIGADDILFPNCIDDFMKFVKKEPNAKWISSYVREYHGSFDEVNCRGERMAYSRSFFDEPVEKQLWIMARRNLIYTPSILFNTNVKREVGGYDTTYRIEDYPLFMKLLERGYKCYFLDKETVGYRIHESQAHSDVRLFHYENQLEVRKFRRDLSFKYLTKKEKFGLCLYWKTQDYLAGSGRNNKNNRFASFIYKAVSFITFHFFIVNVKN